MRKVVQRCAVLGVFALAPCHAVAHSGQEWSTITGKTLGEDATAIHLQAAWPGLSVTLLHGYGPTFDFGGTLTFNYSYEGDVRAAYPGLKLQGYVKATLVDKPRYNIGLSFAPGILTYFFGQSFCTPLALGTQTDFGYYWVGGNVCSGGGTQFGIAFPAGLTFGIPARHNLNLAFTFDVPLFVTFGDFGTVTIPVLFGGGVEYFLDSSKALTFNLRTGPMIFTKSGYGSDFTLQALVGLALKFR